MLVDRPKTTEERLQLARRFAAEFQPRAELLVDSVEDTFEAALAPWPVRPYLIRGGRVEHVGRPVDGDYTAALLEIVSKLA